MRAIVLLLAVVMMTGVVGQVASASPDAVTAVTAVAVDDMAGVDTPVLVESAVTLVPERQSPVRVETWSASTLGRMHAVLVFRPPRPLASR